MRTVLSTVLAGAIALSGLAAQGCCDPSKTQVRDATRHISDSAEAGKAAFALCRNPPAGQDPAPLCAAVTQAFDEIKLTSDALGKRAP